LALSDSSAQRHTLTSSERLLKLCGISIEMLSAWREAKDDPVTRLYERDRGYKSILKIIVFYAALFFIFGITCSFVPVAIIAFVAFPFAAGCIIISDSFNREKQEGSIEGFLLSSVSRMRWSFCRMRGGLGRWFRVITYTYMAILLTVSVFVFIGISYQNSRFNLVYVPGVFLVVILGFPLILTQFILGGAVGAGIGLRKWFSNSNLVMTVLLSLVVSAMTVSLIGVASILLILALLFLGGLIGPIVHPFMSCIMMPLAFGATFTIINKICMREAWSQICKSSRDIDDLILDQDSRKMLNKPKAITGGR
jgi:hypothetical protein